MKVKENEWKEIKKEEKDKINEINKSKTRKKLKKKAESIEKRKGEYEENRKKYKQLCSKDFSYPFKCLFLQKVEKIDHWHHAIVQKEPLQRHSIAAMISKVLSLPLEWYHFQTERFNTFSCLFF